MDQEMIKVKYKLCELEQILLEIETVVQDAIQRDNIKTDNDNLNFLLYTLGKSIVTIREIIILCWAGYPDGALSLSSCCGTIIRATREVNVICGDCGEAFERE